MCESGYCVHCGFSTVSDMVFKWYLETLLLGLVSNNPMQLSIVIMYFVHRHAWLISGTEPDCETLLSCPHIFLVCLRSDSRERKHIVNTMNFTLNRFSTGGHCVPCH